MSSPVMQYDVRLFGPNKGKTINLGGTQFVNGAARLVGTAEVMAYTLRVLGYYAAFARGTLEFDAAEAKERESNGAGEADVSSGEGQADAVVGSVQPGGEGPAEAGHDVGEPDAEAPEGEAGIRSEGNGHEDAGVPRFEDAASVTPPTEPEVGANMTVRAAVLVLDPENDDHWTKAGLPALSAVEAALGRAGTTRRDVESAAPGWNREAALAKVASEL